MDATMINVDDIPDVVTDVARGWHDGPQTTMYKLAYGATLFAGEEIEIADLLKEVRDCLREVCDKASKDYAAIQAAEHWCVGVIARADTSEAIRRVVKQAAEAGMSAQEFFELATAEWNALPPANEAEEFPVHTHRKAL
jgi:predicted transcriptional regulator of viral defense system